LSVGTAVVTCSGEGLVGASGYVLGDVPPPQCYWSHGSAQAVFDVTGAGDTVLAVLASAFLRGLAFWQSLEAAEIAGGLAVATHGLYKAKWVEIEEVRRQRHLPQSKIVSLGEARDLVAAYRQGGKKIVFTNGCFDGLHPGHYSLLQEAKRNGDVLIVGVDSDESVRALKGDNRPLYPLSFRASMLAELACVDLVFSFGNQETTQVVRELNPQVLVKGREYLERTVPGADHVASRGGTVVFADMVPGYSTSELVQRVRAVLETTQRTKEGDNGGETPPSSVHGDTK
jgi:D-beta-D-heptose 7-phosphate kinase / D-beta-D-heptose 1-phosphate adenosyltransferase